MGRLNLHGFNPFSCLPWRLRQRRMVQQPPSTFLLLPADILLYISKNHLSPVSAVALSLTCKALFALLFPGAESRLGIVANAGECRQELLLLLEKDVWRRWWYCHGCSLLRRISGKAYLSDPWGSSWAPGFEVNHNCHHGHWLAGHGFTLYYKRVRLVTNRHFFGPPNGLPPAMLDVQIDWSTLSVRNYTWGNLLPWKEIWSARIVHDELFLSATQTLRCTGWTSDEAFRAAFDSERRQICSHVWTSNQELTLATDCSIYALLLPSASLFTPCRNLVESCPWCLTDYMTTVDRRLEDGRDGDRQEEQPLSGWFITITSYHRLGSGRSPTDPKWLAFGGTWDRTPQTPRDLWAYPPGSVKAMWESHEAMNGPPSDPTPSETTEAGQD